MSTEQLNVIVWKWDSEVVTVLKRNLNPVFTELVKHWTIVDREEFTWVSKVTRLCLELAFLPHSHPITSKTTSNRDSLASFEPATCICLEMTESFVIGQSNYPGFKTTD